MLKDGRTELYELKNELQIVLKSLSEIGPEGQAVVAQAICEHFAECSTEDTAKAS